MRHTGQGPRNFFRKEAMTFIVKEKGWEGPLNKKQGLEVLLKKKRRRNVFLKRIIFRKKGNVDVSSSNNFLTVS